jgi:hypothetical protein|nr:MAG TPA: hypothetical protein [Caudoviricetes sp.]
MKRLFIDYELTDGTVGTTRVYAADKVLAEKTSRMHSWPVEDGPRLMTIMLYSALKRTNVITDDYEAFVDAVLVDYQARTEDMDEENPTRSEG